MARRIKALGVRPELEVFDTGQLVMVKDLHRRGADRRSRPDPALHGDPLRRARRSRHAAGAGELACRPARCSRPSRSAACSCPTWPWRCWPAATCASGWRTTCTSGRGQLATNGELVRARGHDPRRDERPRARAPRRSASGSRCAAVAEGRAAHGIGGRAARRRRDRRRLGRPLRAARRRRAPVRSRAGRRGARSTRCSTTPRRAWRRLTLAPLPRRGHADARRLGRGGRRRRRPRPGERARARGAEARAARRGQPARAAPERSSPPPPRGCCPSRLAAEMAVPSASWSAIPFNPVYLLPLVEMCGGGATAPETIERAAAASTARSACAR